MKTLKSTRKKRENEWNYLEGDFPYTTTPMEHRERHPLSMREWLCGKTDDVTCGSRLYTLRTLKPYSIAF